MGQALCKSDGKSDYDDENIILTFFEENDINDMYLTFTVASECYGVGVAFVTEIVAMPRLMEVPDVPDFIKGVINLRGKVVPVMDVRLRFGMTGKAYDERTIIVVLEIDGVPTGLAVDAVNDVLEFLPACINHPPPFGANREGRGVTKGIGKKLDKVAVLLDVRRLVSDQVIELRAGAEA
ncbi:MAG: chemotaxis protein CheW [Rhodospirillaceae bacterium]